MAEFLIESLASKLRQIMPDNARLKGDVKHDMQTIHMCVDHLQNFLRDLTERNLQIHRELLRQITDVVNEAEEIVDAYAVQVAEMKSVKNCFKRSFTKAPTNLHGIAQKLNSVWDQIERKQIDYFAESITGDDDDHEINEAPRRRESDVVVLEDEIDKVRGYLNEECEGLDVITIVGMPGIGKTTLAWTIFKCSEVEWEFPIRIWIKVSHKFNPKDAGVTILDHFIPTKHDMIRQKSLEELAKLTKDYLEKEKFLIVMDDVRSTRDWERLRIYLPMNNNKGRVLITSCNGTIGLYANRRKPPHKVRFLTQNESWELLQRLVFGEIENCPPELESIGRNIAEECKGLPQAIVAMASTLVNQELSFSNMTQRKIAWTKASFTAPQYHNKIFYQTLPCRLRYCLLYFGMFPYDFEIPVWKLIRMWIAEGFLEESEGMSTEEKAEAYLEELINWNLVTVGQTKSDGRVKTCHVHRMMHEFCKVEAGNEMENFLQDVVFNDGDSGIPNCRRLCIHNNLSGFLSSEPSGPHVRSLVSFSNEEIILPADKSSAVPRAFKFLRVLDAKPIVFTKITSDMYQWLHLRYLVISIDSPVLPKPFTRLSKLQTLVVDTTSRTLEVKGDFSGFTELRHFKTNVSTTLASRGKASSINRGQQLQTLGIVSPESCTKELLYRARRLRKLGIRGRLSKFCDGNSFDSLENLENLENLMLLNDVFPKRASEGRLHNLPAAYKFPPRLRILTLASTFLEWSQMRILGSLERLEVLKLKQNAFVGRSWVTEDLGFQSLQALLIEKTDLIFWVSSALHFPQLKLLHLHYCEQLREVPFQLAGIPTLRNLELLYSKQAANSAQKIGEEIKRRYQEGSSKDAKDFKLSVFP